MMLRVFLGACLVSAVVLADEDDPYGDTSKFGCCSHEDRREIQYLWDSVWSASFTERKVMIAKAVFDESVTVTIYVMLKLINLQYLLVSCN